MKTILKLLVVFSLLILIKYQCVEWCFTTGADLCFLQNQPHRGIGMIYAAHVAAPWREDITKAYLCEYYLAEKDHRIMEGKKIPVMTIEAVKYAAAFPFDDDAEKVKTLYKQSKECQR